MRAIVRILVLGRPLRWRLILAIGAGVAAAACAIGLAATSAWLISAAAEQPPILALMVAITAVRAFGIGRGVFRYAERLLAHDAAFRVLADLRTAVFARLARLAPAGLAELRSADLLARLVDDVDGLADLWLRLLIPYASAGVIALATSLLIAWLVPAAGVVLAVSLAVVAIGAPAAAMLVAGAAEARIAPARGRVADAAAEILGGGAEILVSGAVSRAMAELARVDARLAAAERTSAAGAGVGTLVAGLAAGGATWIALVLGIVALRDGSLAGVALAVVALTPIAAHEVVSPLVPAARRLPGLAASASRVEDVLGRPDPVMDPPVPSRVPEGPLGATIRGLRARYPGAVTDALGPVDLVIPAGAHVVVTGPSGSGKSTLAAVCMRFLEPRSGSIALVGAGGEADITSVTGEDARRAVGLCEQDPYVFDSTIADNLRLARPGAPDEDLFEALTAARLDAWVRSLPQGLQTPVGAHGARLSGGQRQRLALARAILADVRILVLDEPTEHLDEDTATAFVRDLETGFAGVTLLVLTHREDLFPTRTWMRRYALPALEPSR